MCGFTRCLSATAIVALMSCAIIVPLSGCVTDQDAELAQLLRELDLMEAREMMGAETVDVTSVKTVETPPAAIAGPTPPTASDGQVGSLTIHPDCLLQITVAEDPSLNGSYKVNDIGAVEVGYLGPVILYNATEREAEQKIERVLEIKDFRNATVKVRMLRASYGRIRVDGAVGTPGYLKVGAGDTISLNNALLRAGGLSASARGGRIRVYRGALLSPIPLQNRQYEEYPLSAQGGQMAVPEVLLGNSDVAIVVGGQSPQVVGVSNSPGKQSVNVLVLGEVNKAGMYGFKPGQPCTVLHLFLKMGGLPPFANKKRVRVIRRDKVGVETEYEVNVAELMSTGSPEDDFPLESGDRVIVPARRFTFL